MDDTDIGKDSQGRDVRMSLELYLKSNGTYSAMYTEHTKVADNGTDSTWDRTAHRSFGAAWNISGTEIVIANLGSGTGLTRNNVDGISFRFQGTDVSPTLNGKTVWMRNIVSTTGENGQSINEYCLTH